MIENFQNISSSEFETLKKAISWITVLIAGADDNIDKEEKEWAAKLTKIRSYANSDVLNDFYTEVGKNFENDLNLLIEELPNSVDQRSTILSERLSMVNEILLRLENPVAYSLYKSYTSFAEHVAKSSGGFLRFMSVSSEEKQLIGLDMINPIELEEEE